MVSPSQTLLCSMNHLKEKKIAFREKFGKAKPIISIAPGRVNLIGEHTDYNNGWVLPAAIDKVSTVLLAPNNSKRIRVFAYDLNEDFEFFINRASEHEGWQSYIYGVVKTMKKEVSIPAGFDILLSGNIPFGAGLSSSASIECAIANGINELFRLEISKKKLALIAQKAEHEFAGVKCGIMDQYASVMGKEGQAMYLDCQEITHEYIPLELGEHQLLLCNTNVSHSLADSEYNTRREQCETGVNILKNHQGDINSLRDVSEALLLEHKAEFSDEIYQRCLYVVQENNRVAQCVEALKSGDIEMMGKQMYASHQGLSEMYEVSCKELDFLVEQTKDKPYILGSRMMGGGFGGCTINIIHKDEVDNFVNLISPLYTKQFGKDMTPIVANIGEGAKMMKQ